MGRIVLLIIAVGVIVGGYVVYSRFGDLVSDGVETYGPQVMKVPVGLSDVSVNPFNGSATLEGLSLGQPKGYGDGSMASLETLAVKLEPMSIFTDHVKVDKISLDRPVVDARLIGSKTNFDALIDNLDLPEDGAEESSDLVMSIAEFDIIEPVIRVSAEDSVVEGEKTISLETIRLTNIGTDEEGMAPREIARHVLDTIRPQVSKAMAQIGLEQFAGQDVDALRSQAKGELKKLETEAREKGLGSAFDKLKSAIKKKKDGDR